MNWEKTLNHRLGGPATLPLVIYSTLLICPRTRLRATMPMVLISAMLTSARLGDNFAAKGDRDGNCPSSQINP